MNRYQNIRPFIVMDIVREAAKFDDSIHFEIGQPDLPPSPAVRQALQEAVAENRFSYTESRGLPALREQIRANYVRHYGIEVAPERILLTPGCASSTCGSTGRYWPSQRSKGWCWCRRSRLRPRCSWT